MNVITEAHGFCLLMHEHEAEEQKLYRMLLEAGFGPWDRNGLPMFVVLESHASKQQWFEAGFLCVNAPLFLVGTGARFRKRHLETISRLGGWAASMEKNELIDMIARRGITPTEWDKAASVAALAKFPPKVPA